MKTLFYVLILSMLTVSANAQTWIPVNNLDGTTAHYGTPGCETDVTVAGAGAFTSAVPALYCGIGPYWIGNGGGSYVSELAPGRYTYTFSLPVKRIRISTTHSHINEIIHIKINSSDYHLTGGNISAASLSSSCTGGTWPGAYVITPGGDLKSIISGPGSGMGASAVITIEDKCINSLEISTNGYYNGTVYSLHIDPRGASVAGTISGPDRYCGPATGTYSGSGVTVGCGATESWTSSHPSIINFATPSSGAATISNVCPSTEVIITHSFSDVCGTVNATTAVTVNPSPVFVATYSPIPLCSGQTYSVGIVPSPCPGETYTSISWSGGYTGTGSPVSRPAVYTPDGVSVPYHVTVVNNYGCPTTKHMIVDIHPEPEITPIPAAVCLGTTRTFNVQASVAGGTWSSFDPIIASVITTGATTGDVTGNNLGTTVITYTSPIGCKGTTNVTVTPAPTAILTASPAKHCAPGGTSLLSATISYTGTGSLIFWWDDPILTSSFPGLTYLASVTSTTTYMFTVTDGICSTTVPITVTVNPLPMVSVTYTGCAPPCPSTLLTYSVHGDPFADVDYSWSDPCGTTGTGTITLNGSGDGTITLTSGPCEGLFHLSITRVYDPGTDCTNIYGFSIQPLDLRWPTAVFCTSVRPKCCDWVDFTICGTPGSTAYIEPGYIPVPIDAYGIGTLHIWLCEEITLTIGDVVGPCPGCTHYSGDTYTYSPLSASAAPTIVCHVEYIDGMWTYWFDVTGIGALDAFTINFTQYLGIIGGSGPCTAGPAPGSVSGVGPGSYFVTLPTLPCLILSIYGVSISVADCTWDIPCTPGASKPGRNDNENELATTTARISVIPNPNTGSFTIGGTLPSVKTSKEATITVTDLLGRVIYNTVAAIDNSSISKVIDLGNEIPNGIYMVSIKNAEVNEVIKFTIDR